MSDPKPVPWGWGPVMGTWWQKNLTSDPVQANGWSYPSCMVTLDGGEKVHVDELCEKWLYVTPLQP